MTTALNSLMAKYKSACNDVEKLQADLTVALAVRAGVKAALVRKGVNPDAQPAKATPYVHKFVPPPERCDPDVNHDYDDEIDAILG